MLNCSFFFCSFVILPDFSLSHLTFSSKLNEMEKKLFGENILGFMCVYLFWKIRGYKKYKQ